MPKDMTGTVVRGGLVVLAGILVVVTVGALRSSRAAPELSTARQSDITLYPTGVSTETSELAIFREVARVHELAALRMKETTTLGGDIGMPVAPSSTNQKSSGLADKSESRYIVTTLERIAAGRRMAVEDIMVIYVRGLREGWPRR